MTTAFYLLVLPTVVICGASKVLAVAAETIIPMLFM